MAQQQGTYFDASPLIPQLFDWLKNYQAGKVVDEYNAKLQSGDYTPTERSVFVDPLKQAELDKELFTRKEAQAALPLQTIQASLFNDPQFRTTEGMRELQNDPAFWLGVQNVSSTGERTKGTIPLDTKNKLVASIVPETAALARKQADAAAFLESLGNRGDITKGQAPAATDPFTVAALLNTKDGTSTIDKLLEVGKQSTERANMFNMQNQLAQLAAVEKDPTRKSILANMAINPTKTDDMMNTLKTLGYDTRNLEVKNIGMGGNLEQSVAINPITGEVVQRYGSPTSKITSQTNMNVANYLPKQLAQGIVDKFGKDSANLQSVQDQQTALKTMFDVVSSPSSSSGLGQPTAVQAKRVLSAFGVKTEGLTPQQLLQSYNTQLAAIATRNTDANPTAQQIAQMRQAYPGLSNEKATNMALIQNMMSNNSRKINEHNARIESLKTAAPDDYGTIKGLYGVADPAANMAGGKGSSTASDYLKKRGFKR